jgi:hypothetical protein
VAYQKSEFSKSRLRNLLENKPAFRDPLSLSRSRREKFLDSKEASFLQAIHAGSCQRIGSDFCKYTLAADESRGGTQEFAAPGLAPRVVASPWHVEIGT